MLTFGYGEYFLLSKVAEIYAVPKREHLLSPLLSDTVDSQKNSIARVKGVQKRSEIHQWFPMLPAEQKMHLICRCAGLDLWRAID
tara:strand:- start:87 stop:341 length:255 start_codon:yes stop_codon:yes gene_type:complete